MSTTEELFAQIPGPAELAARSAPTSATSSAAGTPTSGSYSVPKTSADPAAELDALKNDPAHADFRKDVARGEPRALARWTAAHEAAFGAHANSVDGVYRGMSARDAAMQAARTEKWRAGVNPSTEEEVQAFERGVAHQWEKDACDRNIKALINGPERRAKFLNGDAHLKMMWERWHWVRDVAKVING
jgi:hypothetical protein